MREIIENLTRQKKKKVWTSLFEGIATISNFILSNRLFLEYKSENHTNVAQSDYALNGSIIYIHAWLQCGKPASIFNHSLENWDL